MYGRKLGDILTPFVFVVMIGEIALEYVQK